MRISGTACLLVAAALALASCGSSDEGGEAPGASQGPVHVHGLGVNPKDGALFIATHTGLFSVSPGEQKAKRVGETTQDTMGFTVVGPDRFLGSGHPGELQNDPNPLGLIESSDGGQTWSPVSLSGEADFHVLRSVEDRIYGFSSISGRLFVSDDGGSEWAERDPPEPLVDLVADPRDKDRVVASGPSALYRSSDGGEKWRPMEGQPGLVGWPSASRLFLVDAGGGVQTSGDGGKSWESVGQVGAQPAAFLAHSETELYAALRDGTIKASRDGGATWTVRSTP